MPDRILTAELLSVGTELSVGETQDTNAGELARSLTERGVTIGRIQAVPDTLEVVVDAFRSALDRADLAVSTGGLGPTPDDLTREAIAAVWNEEPEVDPDLEAWLRGLWARRGAVFPAMNLKQAWLLPSAVAIPNENGTAPGWWVDRPDGRVAVALPGPPREMRPMWHGWVLPRLMARGLGRPGVVRTLRLFGVGESQAADLLGEDLLRATNPSVATYARADAVDVRIATVDGDGRTADELADATEAEVLRHLGRYVWARGTTTWPEAIAEALRRRRWSLATTEAATGGTLAALLARMPGLVRSEILADAPTREAEGAALAARDAAGTDVGLAVRMRDRGHDTAVTVAIATPRGSTRERRLVFMGGVQGRHRAALNGADALLRLLREADG